MPLLPPTLGGHVAGSNAGSGFGWWASSSTFAAVLVAFLQLAGAPTPILGAATKYPTTKFPTEYPTDYPTKFPTMYPTNYPTNYPTTYADKCKYWPGGNGCPRWRGDCDTDDECQPGLVCKNMKWGGCFQSPCGSRGYKDNNGKRKCDVRYIDGEEVDFDSRLGSGTAICVPESWYNEKSCQKGRCPGPSEFQVPRNT